LELAAVCRLGGRPMLGLSASARADTFTVSSLADSGAGTLRQAILDANAAATDDTIVFSVNGSITLSSALPNIAGAGSAGTLTIAGNGTANTVINANNAVRVHGAFRRQPEPVGPDRDQRLRQRGHRWRHLQRWHPEHDPLQAEQQQRAATAGGGMFAQGSTTLINSLFTGNSTSGNGGGLFAQGGTLTVINSSFVQNTSTNAGGGMALVNVSSATLKNTLIANNTSVNSSDDDPSNSGSTVNARNSLIETGASGVTGTNVNTLTVDPALDANFVPQLGSPAVNTGDNSLVPVGITTDLAGDARFQQGGGHRCLRVGLQQPGRHKHQRQWRGFVAPGHPQCE
jgi:hypothetical protein